MPQIIIQPSFAAGELAPALWSRVDLAKYHVGAKTLRNFFVLSSGGAANRPGTQFIGRVKDNANPVRLVPFQFNTLQTYILEFGHLYMRAIMNGGYVLEPSAPIVVIGGTSSTTVTGATESYTVGDWVFFTGTGTALDNRSWVVATVLSPTMFTVNDLDGNPGPTVASTAGGTVARIYTLTTPYAGSDLALLKFVQSADVLTVCHTSYAPMDLTRTQHWAWTLNPITFQPTTNSPAAPTVKQNNGGSSNWWYSYQVTACSLATGEESQASAITTVGGWQQLNQNTGVSNVLTWPAVAGADYYRVYKTSPLYQSSSGNPYVGGEVYGYIGTANGTKFTDMNIGPDFTQTPPQPRNPFGSGNNPGVVTYFQQRKVFAGSAAHPSTLWMSQPGAFGNMDISTPSQGSDAITITINSRQVNAITHLVSVNALLALTDSGAFKISGAAQGAALTPSTAAAAAQAYNGCADVPPIIINYDILYVSSKGAKVRDLAYNFYADVFTGSDMTVMSPHLFFGHQILEWAYAEDPFNMVWAVREDGILLGFTYLKEQDVYAWTRHDTQGAFLSIASIPEGQEDSVYMVVSRAIPGINGGNPVKYVERLHSRNFLTNGAADVTQAWFVDCGRQYSGTPVTTVNGLDHLDGASVVALADGNVVTGLTVANGSITLQHPASIITVGLPYSSDLQTLDLEIAAPTIQGKRKKISAVTLRLENSRGLKAGHDLTTLVEIKERSNQTYGQAVSLTTGDEHVHIPPAWDTHANLWIRQDNPLPASILAIIPEVYLGNN